MIRSNRLFAILFAFCMLCFPLLNVVQTEPGDGAACVSRATLTVGPGQTYTTIQEAINDAGPGDTINVLSGTYKENILVNQSVIINGAGTGSTIINGGYSGNVVEISVADVTLSDLTVSASGNGTLDCGIYTYNASTTIQDCMIVDNAHGLYAAECYDIVVRDCELSNSKYGSGMFLFNCSGMEINGNTCNYNNQSGIYVTGTISIRTQNALITDNTCNNNILGYGLKLFWSDGMQVLRNTASGNGLDGGLLWDVDDSTVDENSLYNNDQNGLTMKYCDRDTVSKLNSTGNTYGVYTTMSTGNVFNFCTCEVNTVGIFLNFTSDKNSIINCTLTDNIEHGLRIRGTGSIGNSVYHNILDGNNPYGLQAEDTTGSNSWDDGGLGNYWSDWRGPDEDNNGIVDEPYALDGGALDNFPLTDPFGDWDLRPSITNEDVVSVLEDEEYSAQYIASDPDTLLSELIWTFESDAQWLNFSEEQVLSGTPNNTHVGTYFVNISVADARTTDFTNFTLTVVNVNDPPEILTTDDLVCLQHTEYLVDYEAVDIDPTLDILHWSLETNASFLELNRSTGVLTGIPVKLGSYWVRVEVEDGKGGSDFTNFTLVVKNTNDPPRLNDPPQVLTFPEDEGLIVTDLGEWFGDADGDELTYFSEMGTMVFAEVEGDSLVFSSAPNWSGVETIGLRANDSTEEVELSVLVRVTPVNDKPVIDLMDVASKTRLLGEDVALSATASDVDGDELTYSWSSNISGPLAIGDDAAIPLPEGNHTITLNVSDNNGGWALAVRWILIEMPSPPVDDDDDDILPNVTDDDDVEPPADDDDTNSSSFGSIMLGIGILILILIIIILIFVLLRTRPGEESEEDEETRASEAGKSRGITDPQAEDVESAADPHFGHPPTSAAFTQTPTEESQPSQVPIVQQELEYEDGDVLDDTSFSELDDMELMNEADDDLPDEDREDWLEDLDDLDLDEFDDLDDDMEVVE